jgi:hypothetical protein
MRWESPQCNNSSRRCPPAGHEIDRRERATLRSFGWKCSSQILAFNGKRVPVAQCSRRFAIGKFPLYLRHEVPFEQRGREPPEERVLNIADHIRPCDCMWSFLFAKNRDAEVTDGAIWPIIGVLRKNSIRTTERLRKFL